MRSRFQESACEGINGIKAPKGSRVFGGRRVWVFEGSWWGAFGSRARGKAFKGLKAWEGSGQAPGAIFGVAWSQNSLAEEALNPLEP